MQFNEEMLTAYLDDELSGQEREVVEEAIRQEPRYAQLLEELREVRAAVQSLPPMNPSADPVAAVRSAIQQKSESSSAPSRAGSVHEIGKWIVFATAASLLVGVGIFLYGPQHGDGMAGSVETPDLVETPRGTDQGFQTVTAQMGNQPENDHMTQTKAPPEVTPQGAAQLMLPAESPVAPELPGAGPVGGGGAAKLEQQLRYQKSKGPADAFSDAEPSPSPGAPPELAPMRNVAPFQQPRKPSAELPPPEASPAEPQSAAPELFGSRDNQLKSRGGRQGAGGGGGGMKGAGNDAINFSAGGFSGGQADAASAPPYWFVLGDDSSPSGGHRGRAASAEQVAEGNAGAVQAEDKAGDQGAAFNYTGHFFRSFGGQLSGGGNGEQAGKLLSLAITTSEDGYAEDVEILKGVLGSIGFLHLQAAGTGEQEKSRRIQLAFPQQPPAQGKSLEVAVAGTADLIEELQRKLDVKFPQRASSRQGGGRLVRREGQRPVAAKISVQVAP